MSVTAADVKALRDRTGAGMMDGKRALEEADGDVEKAVEILRVKGQARPKRAGREAAEGTVQSYIHANGKVGVLVEVDCETDFVARNEDFKAFASEVALHVAGSPTVQYVSDEDVPEEARRPSAASTSSRPPTSPRTCGEDRRGQARQVARRGRAAAPDARQRRQARREDDRGAARRSSPPRPARTW